MKRMYSKEFKIKACELVIKENIAVAVVAEKFGIHHVMIKGVTKHILSSLQDKGK